MFCFVFLIRICKILGRKCVHMEVRDPATLVGKLPTLSNVNEHDCLSYLKICDPENLSENTKIENKFNNKTHSIPTPPYARGQRARIRTVYFKWQYTASLKHVFSDPIREEQMFMFKLLTTLQYAVCAVTIMNKAFF